MRLPALALVPALALSLAACGGSDDTASAGADRLDVVVGLYPYAWVLEQIGGDAVQVTGLVAPGVDAHDLELTPQQAGAVAEADLVVRSAGFQPALDEAVEQSAAGRDVDVLELVTTRTYEGDEVAHEEEDHADEDGEEEGHDHGSEDPHLWLDPTKLADVADALADALAERSGDDRFRAAADDLRADLEALDAEYRTGLTGCERTELFTSHDAFGYLADRYGLTQVPVGRSPEQEPSPRQLADVAQRARAAGATTVFTEGGGSRRVAEQVAREAGAEVAELSPLENPPADGDYLAAMRANLDVLRTALGCA